MSTLRQRFEAKIARQGDCWEWIGSHNGKGRGQIKVNGVLVLATHVAWYLKHGVWPTLQLNHTCDNIRCVRIKHLYEGTQKQNLADRRERGRAPGPRRWLMIDGQPWSIDQIAAHVGLTRIAVYARLDAGAAGEELIRPRFERK